MKPVDVAYAAGQLDADGCINVHFVTNNKNKQKYLAVGVNVVSQDKDLLEWFKDTFGGNVYKMGTARAFQWKPSDWAGFLTIIKPYLRTKKQQAELVLEYRQQALKKGRSKRTQEDIAYQQYVFEKNKELNGKLALEFPKLINSRMG